MEHIGLDLGKTSSQICILTEEGELIEKRIKTEREQFARVIGGRGSARILIEASTESEWVAECLEALGHEVIVADPNFAPMYATRSKRIKTDKRDARALCEAGRLGAYRRAHRTSREQRHIRAQLSAREALVGTRTKYIVLIKSLLSRWVADTEREFSHLWGESQKLAVINVCDGASFDVRQSRWNSEGKGGVK
jgi:transposase